MELPPTWFMLVSSSVMGLITRHQAKKHGRNPKLWFWIGFLMGGLGIFAFFLTKPPANKTNLSPNVIAPKINLGNGAWYYANNQETHGPYSAEYIQKLLDSKAIALDTLVWHESLETWEKLEKFKE